MNKNLIIRIFALVSTALCVVSLRDVGEPGRPLSITVLRGVILSLILNAPLWISSFEFVRTKLKYLAAFFVFISGLGVFVTAPYGWPLAFILLFLHIWLVIDLMKVRKVT